jgi:hypothetical protein
LTVRQQQAAGRINKNIDAKTHTHTQAGRPAGTHTGRQAVNRQSTGSRPNDISYNKLYKRRYINRLQASAVRFDEMPAKKN